MLTWKNFVQDWAIMRGTTSHWYFSFNSLAPGRFQRNFRRVIFQLILAIDDWSISCKIVLKWMPMDPTDGKSTLVQVMAWCRQATSHCLSQCWPRSLSPYGVIRPLNWPLWCWSQNISELGQCHDYWCLDFSCWRHLMETFSVYSPFARGIHRSLVNSPHKGQWRGALTIFLICAWTNSWVNDRDAGDLRHNHAHYDVIVMLVRPRASATMALTMQSKHISVPHE